MHFAATQPSQSSHHLASWQHSGFPFCAPYYGRAIQFMWSWQLMKAIDLTLIHFFTLNEILIFVYSKRSIWLELNWPVLNQVCLMIWVVQKKYWTIWTNSNLWKLFDWFGYYFFQIWSKLSHEQRYWVNYHINWIDRNKNKRCNKWYDTIKSLWTNHLVWNCFFLSSGLGLSSN